LPRRPSANALVAGDHEPDGEAPGGDVKALGCLSNGDMRGWSDRKAREAEQAARLALLSREGSSNWDKPLNDDPGALAAGDARPR